MLKDTPFDLLEGVRSAGVETAAATEIADCEGRGFSCLLDELQFVRDHMVEIPVI